MPQDLEGLRSLAGELSMTGDSDALAECERTIAELRTAIAGLRETRDESARALADSSRSGDEYNALLAVYETPRARVDRGPLSGLRVVVKDNIQIRGLEMTCGATGFSVVPDTDAVVVDRLLDAGASILGKANMEAFALGGTGNHSEFGRVENPIAPGRITGGSSSGSAAAVAGGLADVGIGTDTGGSVRVPAACCGLVGVKPTHSLVPQHGFVPLAPSTDVIGPLATDVEPAAMVLAAMAGPDASDPSTRVPEPQRIEFDPSGVDGVTIGVARAIVDSCDGPVRTGFTEGLAAIEGDASLTVQDVDLDVARLEPFHPFIVSEFVWLIRQAGVIRGRGSGYGDEWQAEFAAYARSNGFNEYVTSRVLPAEYLNHIEHGQLYARIRREITTFCKSLANVFEGVDVVMLPTTRVLPPTYEDVGDWDDFGTLAGEDPPFLTPPFSMTGNPVVSLPVGSSDGLPVSAQLVGPHFEDERLLNVAGRIEFRTPHGIVSG